MEFKNAEEFRYAVRDYAVGNKINIKWIKNEKEKACVVCDNSKVCPWRIWASEEGTEKTFRIATINSTHMCSGNVKSRQLNAKWIATRFYTEIMEDPHYKLELMKAKIFNKYGLNVSLGTCSKARRKALNAGSSSMMEHYSKIWDYRNELRRTQKDSTIEVYCTFNNPEYGPIFQRFYICFDALRKGFLVGCRKVLGLDGCFLKGWMKGELLIAVGRDANNQMFPVAWAVVQVESKRSWGWFLDKIMTDLEMGDGTGRTIISDQQKGLVIQVAEMLPGAEHRACARHVYANWAKGYRGSKYKHAFWAIAKSTNMHRYKVACEELKKLDEEAYNDLMKRMPEKWCKAFFETYALSDRCENNMSEGFNGALVEARGKPLIYLLEDLRMKMMTRLHKKREWISNHWDSVCPRIRKKIEENTRLCKVWNATYNENNKFQIDWRKEGYIVDIEKRTCTCREWDLTGIPCPHAIAGLLKMGKRVDDYVAEFYSKKKFLEAYAYSIEPISGENNWEKSGDMPLVPPKYKAMPGRPKTKRVKPAHEEPKSTPGVQKISRDGRKMVCCSCKQSGHNKRGCKNTPVAPDVGNSDASTSRKRRRPRSKEQAQAPTVNMEYKKTRNDGKKKAPEVVVGEKRKRGRPRKVGGAPEPRFDFCGLYTSPTGDTFFKSPGASRAINLDTYTPPPPTTQTTIPRPRPVTRAAAAAASSSSQPTPSSSYSTHK